jgi:hydroxylamine reductase
MITKDMLIGDMIRTYPEVADVLLQFGMHCIGCMAARGETIADACAVHGLDVDELVEALNAAIDA